MGKSWSQKRGALVAEKRETGAIITAVLASRVKKLVVGDHPLTVIVRLLSR